MVIVMTACMVIVVLIMIGTLTWDMRDDADVTVWWC